MSGNQTQVPVIQTQDANQTQSQQNTNKVLRNLNNKIIDLQNQTDQMQIIGEVKLASLTLAQFQAQAGKDWILANGQSSTGTAYEALTLNNTVPVVAVPGTTSFIKVN